MIGIEIFSGVGGMSLGASMAGVKIAMAIEIDKDAAATFKKNHPDVNVIVSDIKDIETIDVPVNENQQKILMGGPPCQGFSKSNVKGRNVNNQKNWLFQEYLRITELWRPDWFVLENVQGLVETEKGLFLNKILEGFKKLGYTVNYKVLNAKNFGVPQNRERLFIVGSLHNEEFEFPEPKFIDNFITVEDAFTDLPDLVNGNGDTELKYKEGKNSEYSLLLKGDLKSIKNNAVSRNSETVINRYQYIHEGGNWKDIPIELMETYKDVTRCHTGIYHRLNRKKPSVVIGNYRKNMLIHPWQERGLSVREAARLQSFPDNFNFVGTINSQQQQVGNAVPPLLAKAVFESIIKNNK
ncbi:DNA (cytosine-5)-methyltransferase 1 [Chryseobacterium ginsenosidimutans]|uniref:DNA cytosine methyltransferase n=1 Tax=Chryseobacterium ginsenosidimutans TaxID=687846 RepID=UPI00278B7CD6|nr:DNA cytosine methyltransferase [Chryseobacterium ginsenosidimutans]MDQ0592185.1 DNA (cytosine-5)-methyltransferase 1 [Chryseobacterium ginsenosidimutans]